MLQCWPVAAVAALPLLRRFAAGLPVVVDVVVAGVVADDAADADEVADADDAADADDVADADVVVPVRTRLRTTSIFRESGRCSWCILW